MGEVFDSLAYEYGLAQAVRDGWLCPIEARMLPVTLDVSGVSIQAGDYAAGQLGDALDPYLDAIADAMMARLATNGWKVPRGVTPATYVPQDKKEGARDAEPSLRP